jgi:hypothetical protein
VSFPGLLAAAGVVQDHALQCLRILEVGDVRIVEGDVAVLAETDKREVDGLGQHQFRVALELGVGVRVRRVALDVMNLGRMEFVLDAVLDPKPKAGGMTAPSGSASVTMRPV